MKIITEKAVKRGKTEFHSVNLNVLLWRLRQEKDVVWWRQCGHYKCKECVESQNVTDAKVQGNDDTQMLYPQVDGVRVSVVATINEAPDHVILAASQGKQPGIISLVEP